MDNRRLSPGSESGQMAITMVLSLLVVVLFFSLAFDAGLWYFDHRSAQNESDAAALAAAGSLPAATTTAAQTAITTSLTKSGLTCMPGCVQVANGGSAPVCPATGECITVHFRDTLFSDSVYDQVTVLVRRPSPILFASLTGTTQLWISASATALAGPAELTNVLPWAVVVPQPSCDLPSENCTVDLNGDGDNTDPGECNNTPFANCPFGLNVQRLFAFKSGGGGNTGIIDACGNGASSYSDCLAGDIATGFFLSNTDVVVGLQGGSLGQNTNRGLKNRFREEVGWTTGSPNPWANSYDSAWASSLCNVRTSPTNPMGFDPEGRLRALATFGTTPPQPYCTNRVVLLPLVTSLPPTGGGSSTIHVVGVASFGIARWDYETPRGMEALDVDNDDGGETDDDCHNRPGGSIDPTKFDCGLVWGYLMTSDIRPPEFLLQKIGTTAPNPLAPVLIALVE